MKQKTVDDLKTWKAIWQVRYPPAALLMDHRGALAGRWQHKKEDLTEWLIANNQFKVHDLANMLLLQADLRSVTIVVESVERQNLFAELATEFTFDVLDTLDVKRIERVGLRLLQVAERANFKAMCHQIRRGFYRLTDDEWQVFGKEPDDVGLSLVFRYEERTLNWNFGPMAKSQLETYFDSTAVKQSLPETSIFIDCDLYQPDPKFHRKEFKKELARYMESGMEQITGLTARFMGQYGGFR